MSTDPVTGNERLVKTAERVRDLAEVFTPTAVVQEMLDLLPAEMWAPHPAPTFLEPGCGDGNFLVAILDRKLAEVTDLPADQRAPAALEALASIYGVDISPDNIKGGPHGPGARARMLDVLTEWAATAGIAAGPEAPFARSALWIVERNILIGNLLPLTADGKPSGRDTLPLCEYQWDPPAGTVRVATTTLGAVMRQADERTSEVLSLFTDPPPKPLWAGPALALFEAGTRRRAAK